MEEEAYRTKVKGKYDETGNLGGIQWVREGCESRRRRRRRRKRGGGSRNILLVRGGGGGEKYNEMEINVLAQLKCVFF